MNRIKKSNSAAFILFILSILFESSLLKLSHYQKREKRKMKSMPFILRFFLLLFLALFC